MMPKDRYNIMKAYMPKVGTLGHQMMFRSCTVQTNLDFSSEADMVKKMRVSLALQPVATALFANSPFKDGGLNGFMSYRAHVWTDTDGDRTGDLPFAFEEGFGYEQYVDWALDAPMYFVKRNGVFLDASGQDFRAFLKGELPALPGEIPVISDFEDHLSTLFPEVRLKTFIEQRGADGGPWNRLVRPAGLLGGPALRRRRRSMPPGTMSRTGPPKNAPPCAPARPNRR
jgi:glutamate--cysteine ligase